MEITEAVEKGIEAGERAKAEDWRPSTNGESNTPLMHVGTQQFNTSGSWGSQQGGGTQPLY